MNITIAEQIETVALCRSSGALGNYTDLSHLTDGKTNHCRIEASGLTFIVWSDRFGWNVSFGPFKCSSADLSEAANNIIEVIKANTGKALISKNYAI